MTDKFISVVLPSLNEELTVGRTIKTIKEAFRKYGLKGEIILIDASSTDKTLDIAKEEGIEVHIVPKIGLGYQYNRSIEYIKGDYVIMGDSDGTYDFLEMDKFIKKLDEGYDLVMGTRLRGNIHRGAMPWKNRYIGTPLLTFFINLFYKANISDCNSGLRAITTSALKTIGIDSAGWEYASEMVVKSKLAGLKITEVPVSLHPDEEGRKPHLTPWKAGWENMKTIWLLASEVIFIKLGIVLWCLGFLILISQVHGALTFGGFYFGTFYMFLGLILTIVSSSIIQLGILIQNFSYLSKFSKNKISRWFKQNFTFEKGFVLSSTFIVSSFAILLVILFRWLNVHTIGFDDVKLAIYSVFLITSGIQIIFFNFVFYLFNK